MTKGKRIYHHWKDEVLVKTRWFQSREYTFEFKSKSWSKIQKKIDHLRKMDKIKTDTIRGMFYLWVHRPDKNGDKYR